MPIERDEQEQRRLVENNRLSLLDLSTDNRRKAREQPMLDTVTTIIGSTFAVLGTETTRAAAPDGRLTANTANSLAESLSLAKESVVRETLRPAQESLAR